mgnify:CR=1 FL=1
MKKLAERISNKWIAVLSIGIFGISMLPIWYLAFYARPSGDDYGYSVLTHAAWVDTHSFIEVIKAAMETVRINYTGWNGDWFTTFLFSFMPEVFVPYSFWIVPFVMTAAVIIATFYFMYEVCIKCIGMPVSDYLIYTSGLLFACYQFIPSTAIGMYWYVGAMHYMIPYAVGLTGIVYTLKFFRTGKNRYLTGLTICAFSIGGSSYFTSLLLFMFLVFSGAVFFKKDRVRTLWLLLPFLVCLVGFIIQCKAPGNKVRGGEEFGLDLSLAVYTVYESLRRGIKMLGVWAQNKTLVFILLFLISVFSVESISRAVEKHDWKYPAPFIFVIVMYGFYSAMFAPEVYSEVFDSIEISLGPETIQFFTFLVVSIIAIWYCEGWMITKIKKGKHAQGALSFIQKKYRYRILFPAIIVAGILVVLNRGWLGDCVDRQVYEYVSSGQAEDFRAQIKSQMDILLDDSIKEAYLVPINPEQGPLMHMPVTTDENAFTNRVVRDFYGKEKVVMIES